MTTFLGIDSEFLAQTIAQIEDNMENESFGVSDLADLAGMSRSNLLRRIQKITGFSVSVLIRKVRLHHAQQMLRNDTVNVSEVSYKVGFNSVSYFIKCFREEYGYPPGQENERYVAGIKEPHPTTTVAKKQPRFVRLLLPIAAITVLVLSILWFIDKQETLPQELEKSIAVLPFKNNSADSSNVYIINGLMESILNNLQKIEGLRVISRTSVEPYRNTQKTVPRISEELGVNYFIEGSGQKVGDQILLSVNLVYARTGDNIWSEQYSREVNNIFALQADVAKDIAREIKVFISPQVENRIEKKPTSNLKAYDLYLRGVELANQETIEGLERALIFFDESIIEDHKFALPYAFKAICYYYLDLFESKKQFEEEILANATRALDLDDDLPQGYIAKGLYYMQTRNFDKAVSCFERVLEINPNSAQAYNYLADIYNIHMPNTEQYLLYALKAVQLVPNNTDSSVATISYLHLANALIQAGFVSESEKSIERSLAYDSNNIFSQYLYAYILLAKDNDIKRSRDMVERTYQLDSTRLDVLQELGKLNYYMGDYNRAYDCYNRFATIRNSLQLNIYPTEDLLIGMVYAQHGDDSLAQHYYDRYKVFADSNTSIYKDLFLASYHTLMGEESTAIAFLKRFSEQKHIQYWFIRMFETDPLFMRLHDHPDFGFIVEKIKSNFWAEHESIKAMLKDAGVL